MTRYRADDVVARIARLGRLYDRLLSLTAGERAYRAAGDQKIASALAAERVDILDDLSSNDRDEMLLIAIGRHAPSLCVNCVSDHPPAAACRAAAPVGAEVPGVV